MFITTFFRLHYIVLRTFQISRKQIVICLHQYLYIHIEIIPKETPAHKTLQLHKHKPSHTDTSQNHTRWLGCTTNRLSVNDQLRTGLTGLRLTSISHDSQSHSVGSSRIQSFDVGLYFAVSSFCHFFRVHLFTLAISFPFLYIVEQLFVVA